jgi:hypothetical protein
VKIAIPFVEGGDANNRICGHDDLISAAPVNIQPVLDEQ